MISPCQKSCGTPSEDDELEVGALAGAVLNEGGGGAGGKAPAALLFLGLGSSKSFE